MLYLKNAGKATSTKQDQALRSDRRQSRAGRCCACADAMTVAVILAGLFPIMWGSGSG